jgi:hypothetical protein
MLLWGPLVVGELFIIIIVFFFNFIIVFFVRVSGDVLTWVEERGRRATVTSEIWMFII